MFRQAVVAIAVATALPAAGAADPADSRQPVIVVLGNGSAKQAPDFGTFSYNVRGEGKTQVLALQALATTRARIEGGLRQLDGASKI